MHSLIHGILERSIRQKTWEIEIEIQEKWRMKCDDEWEEDERTTATE